VIKCVVPVSGGKDSEACLKLAVEAFPRDQIIGLFCDTKFEHPLTYQHIETMRVRYGVRIETISDGDVITRCLRYRRFPSGTARFCTDDLKIKPTKRFIENLAAKQGEGFQVWYGMRQNESRERKERYKDRIDTELYPAHVVMPKKYPAHLEAMGIMFRLPIVDWTDGEVFDFLEGKENPLYKAGFKRVGCFPCLASGDEHKNACFSHDATGAQHRALVKTIEDRTGKSVWTSKNGKTKYEEQGCLLCSI